MPQGLWRRVERRFAPARVLEIYASTETGAILVNLRDAKVGAMGRPLPGSPELRIAAYDAQAGQLILGADGFVRVLGRRRGARSRAGRPSGPRATEPRARRR